jgi:hypothetical protein
MRKLISFTAVAALCTVLAPAAADAANGIPYRGKASGGHVVKFTLQGGKIRNFASGIPTTCLSIQGGGAPLTGVEPVTVGWMRLPLKDFKVTAEGPVSFHYRDVTQNWTLNTYRLGKKVIGGSFRLQYEFLIPKYPIGTFTIYSCLGNMKFTARPAR